MELRYISKVPQPVKTYDFLISPLDPIVWLLSMLAVLALASIFHIAYHVYMSEHLLKLNLVKYERHALNFYIYSFTKLTEPDPLPWFDNHWSAGRFAYFLWTFLSLLMTMFYTSNLRAHLITVTYEKPIDTLNDIIQNGKTVYLYTLAVKQRYIFFVIVNICSCVLIINYIVILQCSHY